MPRISLGEHLLVRLQVLLRVLVLRVLLAVLLLSFLFVLVNVDIDTVSLTVLLRVCLLVDHDGAEAVDDSVRVLLGFSLLR